MCKSEIFAKIINIVSKETEVSVDQILSSDKNMETVDARYLLVFFLFESGMYPSQIAAHIHKTKRAVNYIYTPSFIVRGKSGLDFNFDFQIAGRESELVVKSFNTLRQDNVSSYLFCLGDTKEEREKQTGKSFRSLAIINDSVQPSNKLIEALNKYGTNVLLWKDKNKEIFNVA